MSKSNLPRHFRPKKSLLVVAGLVTSCLGSFISPVYADNMVCYAIADNDRYGNHDYLLKIDASTGELVIDPDTGQPFAKPTDTRNVEASAFDCEGNKLYVVDGGVLGTLDVDAGTFSPISPAKGLGFGKGVNGVIDINDIDGLAFDCSTNKLYGSHRREEQGPLPTWDLLVEINPLTGKLVPNAFGTNKDYVPIMGSRPDIDDFAWDPGSETLENNDQEIFVIANEGMGKNSYLGNFEKTDASQGPPAVMGGKLTGKVVNERKSKTVDDIESLTFASEPNADGSFTLYGTTGDSIGAGNTSTAHRLYKINKKTGATTSIGPYQALAKGEKPQHDFEAVACRSEIPNCFLYTVHDEGRLDSQIIKIDPFREDQNVSISLYGGLHEDADIEGLVIVPPTPGDPTPGKFYGFSGGDGVAGVSQGAVYEITRTAPVGDISLLGLTGFREVSGAALQYVDTSNPLDGVMDSTVAWGWARNKPAVSGQSRGPITVDLGSPGPTMGTKRSVSLSFPPGVPSVAFPDIESIAMSNDGKTLYGLQYISKLPSDAPTNGTYLWAYDVETKKLEPRCLDDNKVHPFLHTEVEGLEMQPNGLLLFVVYYKGDWGLGALDPADCSIKATWTFKSSKYLYDLESIEWPADECRGRSLLYPGSGDSEIWPLPEYEDVPKNVVDAMNQALDEMGGEAEVGDGAVQVYAGGKHLVFQPTIFDKVSTKAGDRGGVRSEEDGSGEEEACLISEVNLLLTEGTLSFTDCTGSYDVRLDSLAVVEDALLAALNQVGEATIDRGKITVTLENGDVVRARLSAEVQTEGTVNLAEPITAQLVPTDDGNFRIVYSTGQSQDIILE